MRFGQRGFCVYFLVFLFLDFPTGNGISLLAKAGKMVAKKAAKAGMQYAKEKAKEAALETQKKMAAYLRQKARGTAKETPEFPKEEEYSTANLPPFNPTKLQLQIQKTFQSQRVLDIYFLLLKSKLFSDCGMAESKQMFCHSFQKLFSKRNSPIFNNLMQYLQDDKVFTKFSLMFLYLSANWDFHPLILKTKFRSKNSLGFETFIARSLRIANPKVLEFLKFHLRSFFERDANSCKLLIASPESCQTQKQLEVFFTKIFVKSEQKEFAGFLDLLLSKPKFASLSPELVNQTLRMPFLADLPIPKSAKSCSRGMAKQAK